MYLRDLVTFKEAEIAFENGLVVFTGPSGAGKSVLISAILSAFGHTTLGTASLCELNLSKPSSLISELYELDEEITVKTLKKEKVRHYIDGQNIPKKTLKTLFEPYVQYLSVRDKNGFESDRLTEILDASRSGREKEFKKMLKEYKKRFAAYRTQLTKLERIKEDEAKLAELIEFATYEVQKIENIDPKPDEEEELMYVKQQLSRIDKIKEAVQNAVEIFDLESNVQEIYRLLDKDASLFNDAMNQLRSDIEETESLTEELEELDIEQILDRISELAGLKSRYGSIEEALVYKEKKKSELEEYRNIEHDKSMLTSFILFEEQELMVLSRHISNERRKEAELIEDKLKTYLSALKLPNIKFVFQPKSLDENGSDYLDIMLGDSSAQTLSGGEFNRVRLALMASTIGYSKQNGILILDEIDANVSGDESIAIAQMLKELSNVYQIFAISHQPHLSAQSDQHITVVKKEGYSYVQILDEEGRVEELARIISGENPTPQAVEFAKRLRY